jgi:hypothetical protein
MAEFECVKGVSLLLYCTTTPAVEIVQPVSRATLIHTYYNLAQF